MRRDSRPFLLARAAGLPPAWPEAYGCHQALSVAEAQDLDRRAQEAFGRSADDLMRRAALGLAALVTRLLCPSEGRPAILCGPGSNGGDGYACALVLADWGYAPRVWALAPPPPRGPAWEQARLCAATIDVEECYGDVTALGRGLDDTPLLVDAVFGIGLSRPLEARWQDAIGRVNEAPAVRVSADLPSGMDGDSGLPLPVCVRADVTATMAAPKRGLAPGSPGALHAGRVVEVDIGLPWALHGPLRLPAPGAAAPGRRC